MLAPMRDHAVSEMMVLLSKGVECCAKIAMTALSDWCATTRLLPKHDLQRRIFLDANDARICSS
jgi:hypothetical protein